MPSYITDFNIIRPRFELEQEKSLEWIAKAHSRAEAAHSGNSDPFFGQDLKKRLLKIGMGKDRISVRGIQLEDFFSENWSEMAIYPLDASPYGAGFKQRSMIFDQEVSQIFEKFYPEEAVFPDHLIHVTCTGYVAPSPAQQIVSKRGQGEKSVVTHAYHMGCYASLPALRMGSGFLHLPSPHSPAKVDIVHTELCSLHMHPLNHSTEQLIVQSLFADGFIKYSLRSERDLPEGNHFKILALLEETIPNSTRSMTWSCEEHGMAMTLSKDVPELIATALKDYMQRLTTKSNASKSAPQFFAVHPGGPKILLQIERLLGLKREQMEHSYQILKTCGNMSSATLPHIWNLILSDDAVPTSSQIISLAFGPGLSISGGIFEKQKK